SASGANSGYPGSRGRGRRGVFRDWRPGDGASAAAPKYAVLDTPDGGGVRMGSETWTLERVIAETLADPRLADARDRCAVLRSLALWDYLPRGAYASAGDRLCAHYAFDAYPLRELPP